MKKYSIYETKNARGYSQRFINLNKEIVDNLNIKKGDELYFVFKDDELLLKKKIEKNLQHIFKDVKDKKFLDFIFQKENILVKKSKVIGDMQTGKRYHKLTIPSYICDKLQITSENYFTYDLLEDCVRINLEV